MQELLSTLRRWLEQGDDVALATVVATRQSAPRPVGSVLGVTAGGELAGSVSAGCVENEVYAEAREVLAGAAARERTYGITDEQAIGVGLPCGGEIDVFVARADPELLRRAVAELELGRLVSVEAAGDRLELSSRPAPRLVVVGAIDTAEALCRIAHDLGWRTIVVDPRERWATRDRVPSADEIAVEWPDEALSRLEPDDGTAVVVLAHQDQIDLPALRTALDGGAFFVGAIGSRRTQGRRREALLELGVEESDVDRIRGPVGLDVGAQTPAETAVAIMAEILAVRAGRDGGPLRERGARIHA
ncbi:MAG TPA: XdhC/CoxI family protein [Gaiellaceae bacterium]|nr:XdhC/CoxI family protein [Gaiellaceae bacterium]